jgi:hypothetical protein
MSEYVRKTNGKVMNFKQFLKEQHDTTSLNNLCEIIDEFTNKYGKTLAAYPHIKRVENDVLWILAEKIDIFLDYGNHRKILSILNNFTKNDALFDDNNMGLCETILDELYSVSE